MKKIFYILWLFSISLSCYAFQLPSDFEATYRVNKYDTTIAEMKLTLEQTDNSIVYKSHSETRGLAAIFSSEEINETSHLLWNADLRTPHLHKYQYQRKNKKKRNQQFILDWSDNNTALVKGAFGNNTFQLEIKDYVWDRLFVQLVIASDLQEAEKINKKYSYNIIDNAHLTQYHFEYIINEKINIDNNSYETVKFKRTHASGNRITYFWLSKELHYLPVRIEQYRKGELDLNMTLSNITFTEKTQ